MASASNLVGSNLIKAGDNLRIDQISFLSNQTGADITVLTRSGKGFVEDLTFISPGNSSTLFLTVNSIKVTIDGAAERTFNFATSQLYRGIAGVLYIVTKTLPINYNTSITVKVNYDTNAATTDAKCYVTHSIR
jgi:hypothetical protein